MTRRHVPDSSAMTGTYDTSDTAGPDAPHAELRGVTSAFDIARAGDLAWALRSMDPDDEGVSPNVVQTSPGLTVNRGDPDADRQRITNAARRAREAMEEAGMEVNPVSGAVRARSHPASQAPADDQTTDRSAG